MGIHKNFNPNDLGLTNGNLYGLPFSVKEANFVIIPVPWEVTTSYGCGAAQGPAAILNASLQVDLYEPEIKDAWKLGLAMLPISKTWLNKNKLLKKKAAICIRHLEKGGQPADSEVKKSYQEINAAGAELNNWVKQESLKLLEQGKAVGVLGGEHSAPLGLMQALAQKYQQYSILHLDAHMDSRSCYEGFEFSHASVIYNAARIKNIVKIAQAGARDYCEEEADFIENSRGRMVAFTDRMIRRQLFGGTLWQTISREIIKPLSSEVYVSFDIDALEPSLCPNTGTPVPSGFNFEQALYLIEAVVKSGRKIIGFDLCEVAPGENSEWDANVGARVLWRLVNLVAQSQGKF